MSIIFKLKKGYDLSIERISAFSLGNEGGNPAGVVFSDNMLNDKKMLEIAKEVNYSETAFLTKEGDSYRMRYFSPETEIAFCGHATIASGRVLGEKFGEGDFHLILNDGEINLKVENKDGSFISTFSSLNTHTKNMDYDTTKELLDIFNLTIDDLDSRFPVKIGNSGNNHPIIFLKDRDKLKNMKYDFERAKKFMTVNSFVTVSLLFFENESLFHARNSFAYGGVYEDPATGSAAVALAEYLRSTKIKEEGEIEILQGFDMKMPSQIYVTYTKEPNSPVSVSGFSRVIK